MLPFSLLLVYALSFIPPLGCVLFLLMRFVWVLPCLYTAVGVCAVLYFAVRVDAALFTAIGVDAAFVPQLV